MKRTIIAALVLVMSAVSLSARGEQDCTAIDDPEARLACYDQQFARSNGAEADQGGQAAEQEPAPAPAATIISEPVAVEPAEPAELKAAETAVSSSQKPGKGGLFDQDERVDLTSTITHVHARAQQKMVFQLENKQVWMQSVPRLLRIREGDQVTIENASVGGYMMRTDRGVTTRVERIR